MYRKQGEFSNKRWAKIVKCQNVESWQKRFQKLKAEFDHCKT